MNQDQQQLHQRVEALENRLASLEAALATAPSAETSSPPPPTPVADFSITNATGMNGTHMVFLLGRSIMVLGGAFLLRFTTESGVLPPLVGFGLGLTYALVLIGLANRVGRQQVGEGIVHGLTGVLVGYPFLYETIVTLKLVSPTTGGLALALLTGAGIFTAWQRHMRLLAWGFTFPALTLTVALGFATERPVFFGGVLLVLGAVTVLLAYTRGWHWKRWVVAGVANLVVFRLSVMAADQARDASLGTLSATSVQALCLGLMGVYLGLFVFRSLVQGRGARAFDVVQSAAVLLVGFGGALRLSEATGSGGQLLGLVALAAGLVGYTLAFTVIRQKHGRGRGFFYFASLGLIFLLLASRATAHGAMLSGTWLALGLGMAALGGRLDRFTLRTHSVVYLLLALIQTRLLISSVDAFTAGADTAWHQPGLMGHVALVVTAAAALLLARLRGGRETNRWRKAPRLLALLLVLPGLTQITVYGLVAVVGEAPPQADPQFVAAVRTGILSLLAIGLALLARRPAMQELRWLVYPVLVLGLAKVVVEDLRLGDPLGLFFAFAMIGGALILAPRFMRRQPVSEVQ